MLLSPLLTTTNPTSFVTADLIVLALLGTLPSPCFLTDTNRNQQQMVHVAKRAWLSRNLSRNPLNEPGILQLVLSYAGPGLIHAAVSCLWLDAYRTVNGEDAISTSTSAVITSASRLRWAHDSGLPLSAITAAQRRLVGRVADSDMLVAAHELCADLDPKPLALGAADAGSLHALIWLHSKHSLNCPLLPRGADNIFDYKLVVAAAGAGHVHVLDFLHQHGCPLRVTAFRAAASANHVHALRWLRTHTPSWHLQDACVSAAAHGSIDALAYMLPYVAIEGTLMSTGAHTLARALTDLLNIAGSHGQLEAAKWLRQQGADWPRYLDLGRARWSEQAVSWAREQGFKSRASLLSARFAAAPVAGVPAAGAVAATGVVFPFFDMYSAQWYY
jgi:hypothetical protein